MSKCRNEQTFAAADDAFAGPWTIYAIVETAFLHPRVVYVGRTTKPLATRLKQHRAWLDVKAPVVVPLQEGLALGLACQAEADWIATYDPTLNAQRPQAILLRKRPSLAALLRKARAA